MEITPKEKLESLNEKLLPEDNQIEMIDIDPSKIDFTKIFNADYFKSKRSNEKYYKQYCHSAQHLEKILRTNLVTGINDSNPDDIKWRKDIWGTNAFPPEESNSIIDHIIECFDDPTLRILLAAAIVSFLIGVIKDGWGTGWIEGTAIFAAVFIVCSISSYMNYNEKEQFLALSRENRKKQVVVVRNAVDKTISVEDVLVGDLLKTKIGDIVCADGILFGNGRLDVDESPVTGESNIVKKQAEFEERNEKYYTPIILSGSLIEDGMTNMLVCAVGDKTFAGSQRELIEGPVAGGDEQSKEAELTPLRKQLNDLADNIGYFGMVMAVLIGVVLVGKEAIIRYINGIPLIQSQSLDIIVSAFILAVTVVVVAIPEGLPMSVTISFAYSVLKMKEQNNLVKHIEKSEAMGNVDNVCTDKTGTLTLGIMQLTRIYVEGRDYKVIEKDIEDERIRKDILHNMWKNMTCTVTKKDNEEVITGDSTEKAMFNYLTSKNYDTKIPREPKYRLLFNSENKFMISIYEEEDGYILYIKGAQERVKQFLTKCQGNNGEEEEYNKYEEEITGTQRHYSEGSIRTLVFGYRQISKKDVESALIKNPEQNIDFFKELAQGSTFAFMIGLRDENRPDVPEAIIACKNAGITVRMVTGDNLDTALAIGNEVKIIEPEEVKKAKSSAAEYKLKVEQNLQDIEEGENVDFILDKNSDHPKALEGDVFRVVCGNLTKTKTAKGIEITLNNKANFEFIVQDLKIIARASPEDKFLLVFGLKQMNCIVAVTGDGTNDAPALKQSHVGFAMGKRGTDIAKNAADIILLDDSFNSIVIACKYGRNIYDCIRKFVQFQLTTNVVAVFMTFLGGIILKDAPLNAIQMLWVNLIMDSFASLALATEAPTDDLLNRKPYKRNSSILTKMMIRNIASQAIFQICVLCIFIFFGDKLFGVPSDRELSHFEWNPVNGYHFTLFFNVFVYMQVCNSINARKLSNKEKNVFKGILSNPYYLFIQGFILVGQVCITTFGGRAVRTHALSITQHLMCFAIASLTLIVGYLIKFIPLNDEENERMIEEEGGLNAKSRASGIAQTSRRIKEKDPTLKSLK